MYMVAVVNVKLTRYNGKIAYRHAIVWLTMRSSILRQDVDANV